MASLQHLSQECQAPEASGKVWSDEDLPSVGKDQVRKNVNKMDIPTSTGSDEMHL